MQQRSEHHANGAMPIRKCAASATHPNGNTRRRVHPALPCRGLRSQIWEAAKDMLALGDDREISRVLSSRFRVAETVVDRILVVEGVTHERGRAALSTGIQSALGIEREAVRTVDEEFCEGVA